MSLCSAGGHQWEVQRRGTPGGHGNLAALEAAEVADISVRLTSLSGRYLCQADISVRLTSQGTSDLPLTLVAKASPSPGRRL